MAAEISVVIPTYKRHGPLEKALTSVVATCPRSVEIIVVDQSPDAAEKVDVFRRRFRSVKYIVVARPNLPRARNIGISRSRGDVILFLDDDAEMQPGCIEAHLAAFKKKNVGIVAGRIYQLGRGGWDDTQAVASLDPDTGHPKSNFDLDWEGSVLYATGGHLSLRRDILKKTGAFNERFYGNAFFEDIEFSLRARRRGYSIWYTPRAVVNHCPLKQGGCANDNQSAYLLGRLHNHALYYLLCHKRLPSMAYMKYVRNLVEFISRNGRGGHSAWRVMQCAGAIAGAYKDLFITGVFPPRITVNRKR